MRRSRIAAIALFGGLVSLLGGKTDSQSLPTNTSKIVIDKSDRRLYVYEGSQVTREYPASFGVGEFLAYQQKSKQGDKKTPEGLYHIVSKHPSRKFRYFLGINYPNSEDAKRGLDNGVIDNETYQSLQEAHSNNTPLGGDVGIHGEKHLKWISLGPWVNWTRGCVSLKDEDIADLYEHVKVGTEVTIRK